jgi:hypothetical protein
MRKAIGGLLVAMVLVGPMPASAHRARGIKTDYRGHVERHDPDQSAVRVRLFITNRRPVDVALRCVVRASIGWIHLVTEEERHFSERHAVRGTVPARTRGRSRPLTFRIRHPEFVPEYEADPTNWVVMGWGFSFRHCHVR